MDLTLCYECMQKLKDLIRFENESKQIRASVIFH